ncbi:MAG: Re/Si-specific NAD(P)(+) transhydrogenase subunit alpha [Candidatus Eisenbacteria bacterium]|nr:Re/Si-specific NAD(P)(+) transhydrogenase subunit alpha [Candidatus Eisenbacteria bacterium]
MKVAVPKEFFADERRVALVPETVGKLVKQGYDIRVQTGAGERAYFPDEAYREAGATLVPDVAALFREADVVLKVQELDVNPGTGKHEAEMFREGGVVISFLEPLMRPAVMQQLAQRKVTSFSMDAVPRTTTAQRMDALSSQATVSGYQAVLIGAESLPRFFPMLVTAAGTIAPGHVFILGAGVAGLQAISTARRLGAVVEAYDVRPAVKEEVESLGARFVSADLTSADVVDAGGYAKQQSEEFLAKVKEMLKSHVKGSDLIITTARVPGIKAPVMVTEDMIREMKPGSVIVDLAADMGGNCEGTEAGRTVVKHGVTIHGLSNVPSRMPVHASQMYSRNISTLLQHLTDKENNLKLDFEDEITRDSCITHAGEVKHARTRERVEAWKQKGGAGK